MSVKVNGAIAKLHKTTDELKRKAKRDVSSLSRGLYLALSNASVKKGTGTKPKAGGKRAGNGDWIEGKELKVQVSHKGSVKEYPVTDWIKKLKRGAKSKKQQYNLIAVGKQKTPTNPMAREVFRKGSQGKLPYSWGGKGLANYYIRKNWRTLNKGENEAEVRISPARFKNGNDEVLRLLNRGGVTRGSRHIESYTLIWRSKRKGIQNIGFVRNYSERKIIRIKGYKITHRVTSIVKRILKRVPADKISTSHWRKIGQMAGY